MHPSSATVADNIRAEMARGRVSQTRLAEVLGLSQTVVSKRLRGVTPWRIDEVSAIAAALGVPFADLVRDREAVAS